MIQHCKIRKNNANQNKVKEHYYSFFRNLFRKSKQPLAIYQYQLLSSFYYL